MSLPALFLRFVMAGGLNTVITYGVYLLALAFMHYSYAYSLSYALGLIIAYVFNRNFVFKSHRGWRSVVGLPLIYVAQYGIGLGIVWLWVSQLGWYVELAPLAAIALSLPITFILSKWVFSPHAKQ